MNEALKEAKIAFDLGEIPVGAVIVRNEQIIGRGHNLTETAKDPTVHAEMNAIREAALSSRLAFAGMQHVRYSGTLRHVCRSFDLGENRQFIYRDHGS